MWPEQLCTSFLYNSILYENYFDVALAIIDSDMFDNTDIMSVNVCESVEEILGKKRLQNTPSRSHFGVKVCKKEA